MKNYTLRLFSFICLVFIFNITCLARDKIEKVTIFKDRAFVTRVTSIKLPKGNHSIVFEEVTPLLDLDSIKAQTTNVNLDIMGVRTKKTFRKERDLKEIGSLIGIKEKLEKEEVAIQEEVRTLLKENQALQQVGSHFKDSFFENIHNKKWKDSDLEKLLGLFEKRSDGLYGKWRNLYKKFTKNKKELQWTLAKLAELKSVSNSQTVELIVDVLANEDVTGDLSVQYMVNGVSWNPSYDIRIDSKNQTALVSMNALIDQNSGEDWNDVKLILSNIRSEIKPIVPEISPYTLSFHEAKEVKTTISSSQVDSTDLKIGEGNLDSSDNLIKEFSIKGKTTILQGASKSKVVVYEGSFPYRESLEVVPTLFPHAYKKGSLINEFEWTMNAGQANIFYDSQFVQVTQLKTIPKKGPFYINAGVDYGIKVDFFQKNKTTDKGLTGLMGKKILKRTYNTTLTNYSGRKKDLKLLIQVPESEIESVKVDVAGSTKGLSKEADFPSWQSWDVILKPRENQSYELVLAIEAPENFNLSF